MKGITGIAIAPIIMIINVKNVFLSSDRLGHNIRLRSGFAPKLLTVSVLLVFSILRVTVIAST